MKLLVGILLLGGGIAALLVSRPKNGVPRFFVGTPLEIPAVLAIVLSIGVGIILTIGGAVG